LGKKIVNNVHLDLNNKKPCTFNRTILSEVYSLIKSIHPDDFKVQVIEGQYQNLNTEQVGRVSIISEKIKMVGNNLYPPYIELKVGFKNP